VSLKKEIIDSISPHWEEMHFSTQQRDLFIDRFIEIKPKFILETGFATGTSALTTCYSSKVVNAPEESPVKAISVALQEADYKAKGLKTQKFLEENFNFKLIEGRSDEILNANFFKTNYPKGIDFFFVDGGHSFADCLFDMKAGAPFVNKGGYLVVDDYHSKMCPMPDVDKAVDKFTKDYEAEWEKEFEQTEDGKGTCFFKKK
jgi:cephalosporin hydroxylase